MEASLGQARRDTPRRVLVVDDEDLVRATLSDFLELSGYHVCGQARDGYEAARMIGSADPDVVLMDIVMPDMDGIEALQIINATRPTCSLIISAHSTPGLVSRAAQAGAQGFLVKPCRPTDLAPAIETALSQFERSRIAAESGRVSGLFEQAVSHAARGGPLRPALDRALVASCTLLGRVSYIVAGCRGARLRALCTRGVEGAAAGQILGPVNGRLGVALRRRGLCRAHLIGAPPHQAAMLSTRVSLGGAAEGCLCLFAPEGHTFAHREECLLQAMARGLTDALHRLHDARPRAWDAWARGRCTPARFAHGRR